MTTTPEMLKRDADLGWMASTPPDHPLRVTVFGATEEEAEAVFHQRLAVWEAIPNEEAAEA
jgi:hypothetical protein